MMSSRYVEGYILSLPCFVMFSGFIDINFRPPVGMCSENGDSRQNGPLINSFLNNIGLLCMLDQIFEAFRNDFQFEVQMTTLII